MDTGTSVLLMLALTVCVALLGPGLITIEDTRTNQQQRPEEMDESAQQD